MSGPPLSERERSRRYIENGVSMSLRRSPYKGACLIGFLIAQFFEFGLTLGRDGVSDDRIAYYIVYSAVGLIVLVGLFAIGMMVYDYRR